MHGLKSLLQADEHPTYGPNFTQLAFQCAVEFNVEKSFASNLATIAPAPDCVC